MFNASRCAMLAAGRVLRHQGHSLVSRVIDARRNPMICSSLNRFFTSNLLYRG